jgi:hypothetical protein
VGEAGADSSSPAGTYIGGRLRRFVQAAFASDWWRIVAAAVVVGAVLAGSGGFGSDTLMILPRFAYWLTLFLAGVGIGRIAARRFVPRAWFDHRRLWAMGLMAILVSVPMTLIVAAAGLLISGDPPGPARFWGRVPARVRDVAPSTFGVTFGMTALAFLVRPRPPHTTSDQAISDPSISDQTTSDRAAQAAAAGAPPPRFLARLPSKLAGATLWAVEAEDHYLRLHTSKGQDLILMRLADALAELDGLQGARTHRSWWVARAAVRQVERADGRATLTLEGGLQVPVSRGHIKILREAGWF